MVHGFGPEHVGQIGIRQHHADAQQKFLHQLLCAFIALRGIQGRALKRDPVNLLKDCNDLALVLADAIQSNGLETKVCGSFGPSDVFA